MKRTTKQSLKIPYKKFKGILEFLRINLEFPSLKFRIPKYEFRISRDCFASPLNDENSRIPKPCVIPRRDFLYHPPT